MGLGRRAWRYAAVGCLGLAWLHGTAWAQGRFAGQSARALVEAFRKAPAQDVGEIATEIINQRTEAAPALREMLATGTRGDRKLACAMLAQLRDHDSVDALLAASFDPDVEVTGRAVSALRILADARAAGRFRELVQSAPSAGVRKRAMVGLGKVGAARDLALLRPYLADSDESVRVIAAGVMAMLGNGEGEDILLAATHSNNPIAQKDATGALGYLSSTTARQRLEEILQDPDGAWKSYAAIALAIQAGAGASSRQQAAALETLAHSGNRVVASWALDELTDSPSADSTAALRRLSTRPSRIGRRAQLRLRVKEGQ